MLTDIMLALAYASIGLAPLVYSYLVVREEEYAAKRRADSSQATEPSVNVNVIVVVKEDTVSVEHGETVTPLVPGGEDVILLQGPRIEGVAGETEGLEASLA